MPRLNTGRTGQSGNILYLTLILFLLLAAFGLGVTRIICLAAMKIRLQNAADQLALSAATLKARVLNQVTNLNGVLEFLALEGGQVHTRPYYSAADMSAGWKVAEEANAAVLKSIRDYHLGAFFLLDRIARENGLAPPVARTVFHQVPIRPDRDFSWEHETIRYWQEVPYPPGKVLMVNPLFPAVKIEPRQTPWFVQVRLEWSGGAGRPGRGSWLNLGLAGIAVRGRAEIYDADSGTAAWSHHWRVRLRAPDETVDAYRW